VVASFAHPHICVVHDVGREDGADYIVMALLDGETLARRLDRGPLAIEQAIDYPVQIVSALDGAHRHGPTSSSLMRLFVSMILAGFRSRYVTPGPRSVELTATGGTSLRYNTDGGHLIYNWKTPKTPDYCYTITVALINAHRLARIASCDDRYGAWRGQGRTRSPCLQASASSHWECTAVVIDLQLDTPRIGRLEAAARIHYWLRLMDAFLL
jgi:hypothetical protein